MTSTLVKICGLSTPETLDATINAGADWVGLVTFAPSPRHVEPEAAKPLADHARGRATIVSLSVNADDATLDAIASHIKPDIFQLQGKETPGRVADIKARYETSVMKAIGVSTVDDLEKITPYLGIADHILLDAKPPKDAKLPGGNGAAFDWDILDAMPDDLPFMLAGGLNPDNVADAIARVRPFGVDVSSGVESAPGIKDTGLIEAFLKAARSV